MAAASAPVKALPEALPKGKTEETIIKEIQDELSQEITDPVKQSTVDYYYQNKDKVSFLKITLLLHPNNNN